MDENKPLWKQLLGPVIFTLVMIGIVFFIKNYRAPIVEVPDFTTFAFVEDQASYTLENDSLKFVMDAGTTHFTLTDKKSGIEWKSNPDGIADDAIALTDMKKQLDSTMMITYSDRGGLDVQYDNYQYSIERGIYEIEPSDDQIKVKYTIGKTSKLFVIPNALPVDEFNAYIEQLDNTSKRKVEQYYKKISKDKLKTEEKDIYLDKYPMLEEGVVLMELRENTPDYLRAEMEGYFESVGYTYEQYEIDTETYGGAAAKDVPLFNISVVYKLDDNDLVVSVPMEEIEYKKDYPIIKVALLPYFGSAGTEEEGYILVPEGGGGIIDFNNGRSSQNAYRTNVYGWDYASLREAIVNETNCAYPVYGMAHQGSSFLCILEDGNSWASIAADVAGRYNEYNFAYAEYKLLHQEAYNVAGKANEAVYVYEKELPTGQISQRYSFFETNDYIKLAEFYRDYLENRYSAFDRKESEGSIPVAVEILGAVDMVQQKFGVPVSAPLELTTFEEAVDMISDLKARGFDNLEVKLTGWMNKGEKQTIPNKVKIVRDLGSKKDLKNLIAYTNENNIPFYLDSAVMFDYDSNILNGFIELRDCARFTTYEICELYKYSIIYYGADDWYDSYFLYKPELMKKFMGVMEKYALDNNAYGLAFRDAGYRLAADYNRNNIVTREESKAIQDGMFTEIKQNGLKLMLPYGNDYILENVDFVTDMDLCGNPFGIIDRSVPFYQIAIHGYVNYAGEAMNIDGNYEQTLLESAETGAALNFTFMMSDAVDLQRTLYTMYYGCDYEKYIDKATEIYTRYNESFAPLYNQLIVGHSEPVEDVNCTVYEDGTKVYVNYNYKPAYVDGLKIPARDYLVKGAE